MAAGFRTNHIHLPRKPGSEESLYKMMRGLTLCYSNMSIETMGGLGD